MKTWALVCLFIPNLVFAVPRFWPAPCTQILAVHNNPVSPQQLLSLAQVGAAKMLHPSLVANQIHDWQKNMLREDFNDVFAIGDALYAYDGFLYVKRAGDIRVVPQELAPFATHFLHISEHAVTLSWLRLHLQQSLHASFLSPEVANFLSRPFARWIRRRDRDEVLGQIPLTFRDGNRRFHFVLYLRLTPTFQQMNLSDAEGENNDEYRSWALRTHGSKINWLFRLALGHATNILELNTFETFKQFLQELWRLGLEDQIKYLSFTHS